NLDNRHAEIVCAASAHVNVSVLYQFIDTAKRPWPTGVAPRRISFGRAARGSVAPRKMACRPAALLRRLHLELGLGRWPMVTTKTARRLTATSLRPRWRSHQRRARRCRLQRRRLATMRTGANYRLWMVGRQARHGGPTCVQNISWARLGAV